MKKIFCTILLVVGFLCVSNTASAIPILYSNGLQFAKTHNLPEDVVIDSQHVNFGVSFKQFAIFWIPIWNYGDTEYVLINDKGDYGYDLDEEDLAYLKETYDIDTDKAPKIPFWDRIGGKLVWIAIIFVVLIFGRGKKGEEEAEEETEASPEQPEEA